MTEGLTQEQLAQMMQQQQPPREPSPEERLSAGKRYLKPALRAMETWREMATAAIRKTAMKYADSPRNEYLRGVLDAYRDVLEGVENHITILERGEELVPRG